MTTITANLKTKNEPELRFPGFLGIWTEKSIEDLFIFLKTIFNNPYAVVISIFRR